MKRTAFILIIALSAAAFGGAVGWYFSRPPQPEAPIIYELHSALIKHRRNPAKSIEYFYVEPMLGRPWPVVILVHGAQKGEQTSGGRVYFDRGLMQELADEGYLAVSISQPGYGNSDGPRDLYGRLSQSAVATVLETIRARDDVRYDKIAILSGGASAAGRVAAWFRKKRRFNIPFLTIPGSKDPRTEIDSFLAQAFR